MVRQRRNIGDAPLSPPSPASTDRVAEQPTLESPQAPSRRIQGRQVSFSPVKQGPSGTGQTDTRHASPTRPSLRQQQQQQQQQRRQRYETRFRADWFTGDPDIERLRDLFQDAQTDAEGLDASARERVFAGAHRETVKLLKTFAKNKSRVLTGAEAEMLQDEANYRLRAAGAEIAVDIVLSHLETWLAEKSRGHNPPPDPIQIDDDEDMDSEAGEATNDAPAALDHFDLTFAEDTGEDNGKDTAVCEGIDKLVQQTVKFADAHWKPEFAAKQHARMATYMNELLVPENRHLIRYIGYLAQGGPSGERSWQELLTDAKCRRALVVGIIGRALKEHVFADLWFGGRPEEKNRLEELEKSDLKGNGFSRTRERAKAVQQFAQDVDPGILEKACAKFAARMLVVLQPFADDKRFTPKMRNELLELVKTAADLSRKMRLAPDVVYYWPPTFKDEEFEPARMESLNLTQMILDSPYERKKIHGTERAILRKDADEEKSEAIVRIVCFPGIQAYRQYGGKLGAKELADEKKSLDSRPDDVRYAAFRGAQQKADTGFRTRVIRKGLVYLQWGRQRLLTKEAGTSTHIDAVKNGTTDRYEDDYAGFKELYEIALEKWEQAER